MERLVIVLNASVFVEYVWVREREVFRHKTWEILNELLQ